MPRLHVVRVFVGDDGGGGNPLGVFLDPVPAAQRQAIAADLGFSETVFLDDPATGRLEIYTQVRQLPFAGHPLVGTAWLLDRLGVGVDVLRPPAGEVPTWTQDGVRWIRGRAEWAPHFDFRQYESVEQVDALTPPPEAHEDCWAWLDEAAGEVRSRVFAGFNGTLEDEATGAAAIRLVTQLGRPIRIRQGVGSVLYARSGPDGSAEVGGRVGLADTP